MQDCNMDTKRFSALIDSFYSAALEPGQWAAAAAQIASLFSSESTVIQVRAVDFSNIALRATTPNYSQAAQRAYAAYWYKHDPWANGWHAKRAPGIYAGPELADPEVLRNSEVYNDCLRRVGVFHFLGARLDLDGDTKLLLGIHRPIDRDDFSGEHRRRLEVVLPHLSRAVQMNSRLAQADLQRHLACETFEALSVAAIVVDAAGKVAFANQVADRLLSVGDGLTVRQARLTTSDSKQETSLWQAIALASCIAAGGVAPASDVLLVRRARKRPLSVLVVPFRKSVSIAVSASASALVFANDPEARHRSATAALSALYKLTPAEARLLEALLQGERIAEYADRVGISTNTANTQLKQIFAKTDTNRQVDLMRQFLSDPIASLACA
jgi:DNA-binding CsgD family transcriptional regulator/PAS domain-containing protein